MLYGATWFSGHSADWLTDRIILEVSFNLNDSIIP